MNFDHSFDSIYPTATDSVTIGGTTFPGGLNLPSGTTAQRAAAPIAGSTRWNTTLGVKETWNGSSWNNVVSVASSANSYAASNVLASPFGSAGAPSFRTLVLDDLSDVLVTSPATNQILVYNGTQWTNVANPGANKVLQVITGNIPPQTATYGQYVISGTAPTSATGTLIFTQAITPTNTTSRIYIQFTVTVSHTTGGTTMTGLVLAGTTVLTSAVQLVATANGAYAMTFSAVYTPGTTAAQSITFRMAQSALTLAGFINELSTTNTLGGLLKTQYVVTEVA